MPAARGPRDVRCKQPQADEAEEEGEPDGDEQRQLGVARQADAASLDSSQPRDVAPFLVEADDALVAAGEIAF